MHDYSRLGISTSTPRLFCNLTMCYWCTLHTSTYTTVWCVLVLMTMTKNERRTKRNVWYCDTQQYIATCIHNTQPTPTHTTRTPYIFDNILLWNMRLNVADYIPDVRWCVCKRWHTQHTWDISILHNDACWGVLLQCHQQCQYERADTKNKKKRRDMFISLLLLFTHSHSHSTVILSPRLLLPDILHRAANTVMWHIIYRSLNFQIHVDYIVLFWACIASVEDRKIEYSHSHRDVAHLSHGNSTCIKSSEQVYTCVCVVYAAMWVSVRCACGQRKAFTINDSIGFYDDCDRSSSSSATSTNNHWRRVSHIFSTIFLSLSLSMRAVCACHYFEFIHWCQ